MYIKHIKALTATEAATLDPGEDMHCFPQALGESKVSACLAQATWLSAHLEQHWPGKSGIPIVDAFSRRRRLVTFAALLRTWYVDDLVIASGLPRLFVSVAVSIMLACDYVETFDDDPANGDLLRSENLGELVKNYMNQLFEGRIAVFDLVTALGVGLRDE